MTRICEGKRLDLLDRDGWEYAERKKGKEAVAVIAQTDDGKLVLTEQKRKPVNASVIDLPAGLVGDEGNSDPAATAKKELEEETGYSCQSVEFLSRVTTSPGITSELVSFFRASGVRRVGSGGGVGGEKIVVHEVHPSEIVKWLADREREGKLVDVKVWSALFFISPSAQSFRSARSTS